ncbi:MAG TPA: DinB family protein [Ktedonobacterales bacterium]|nr:DinB family protein [Ktedonobacterales bacterium]
MDTAERQALIARYKAGPAAVRAALAGATEAALDARGNGWTAREVVHHLADAETRGATRLRMLLAEDQPVIPAYDSDDYAGALHYDRPIASALAVLEAVHRDTGELLDRLIDAEWARAGTHTTVGPYAVTDWLRMYAAHTHDHAEQIRRALGVAGQ